MVHLGDSVAVSEYGRLWQRVSEIRKALKSIQPTIDDNSLGGAIRSVERLDAGTRALLAEWADLELKMGSCVS